MKHKFDNILGTVGNTPVVRINNLAPDGINLFVKIEAFNPLGSVKDRLALGVIEDAEQRGTLKPGQTVVEATSGNTGIGLAMVCAAKGYPLVVTMAETFSIERRKLMRFLGAKVVITPGPARGTGMVKKAEELAAKNGWFLTRQFTNEANADFHSRTTAQEILRDFEGDPLDFWVTGFGTGGTLKGVSRVLAEKRPDTKIILCEPDAAPMVSSGLPQPNNPDGTPSASHPSWTPHPQQGWSPDFIPKLAQDAIDTHRIHQVLRITNPEAMAPKPGPRQKRRHLRRHQLRGHLCWSPEDRRRSPQRLHHPRHAARHRRTLPHHPTLRRRPRRHDPRRTRNLPLHPQRPTPTTSGLNKQRTG